MKVYISGKIGEEVLSETTRQKFAKAETVLRSRGCEVFNPTTSGLGGIAEVMSKVGMSMFRTIATKELMSKTAERQRSWYDCILLIDLEELSWCDAIYMMDDWRESPGATAEYYVARAMNIHIIYQNRREAEIHLSYTWRMAHLDRKVAPTDAERAEEDIYIDEHLKEVWMPLE